VRKHVQIRPSEHRTDDLRVLTGVHHPTCQGMPKRVETERLTTSPST
jgi:hypothetical protein